MTSALWCFLNKEEVFHCQQLMLASQGSNADNEDLLQTLHKRRTIHLTPTKLRGLFVLRFAVCSRMTESEDVHYAWQEICAALQTLEQEQGR